MMQSIVSAVQFCDENLSAYYRERGRTVLVENAVKDALTDELATAIRKYIGEHGINADVLRMWTRGDFSGREIPYGIVVYDKTKCSKDVAEEFGASGITEKEMIAGISLFTQEESEYENYMLLKAPEITKKHPNLRLAFFDIDSRFPDLITGALLKLTDNTFVLKKNNPMINVMPNIRNYCVFPSNILLKGGKVEIPGFCEWVFGNITGEKKEDSPET